jgi:hypothetical protein
MRYDLSDATQVWLSVHEEFEPRVAARWADDSLAVMPVVVTDLTARCVIESYDRNLPVEVGDVKVVFRHEVTGVEVKHRIADGVHESLREMSGVREAMGHVTRILAEHDAALGRDAETMVARRRVIADRRRIVEQGPWAAWTNNYAAGDPPVDPQDPSETPPDGFSWFRDPAQARGGQRAEAIRRWVTSPKEDPGPPPWEL